MHTITYHRAGTAEDISILVENRFAFSVELMGEQPAALNEKLRRHLTAYFTKATANEACISYIAKCDGEVAGIGSVVLREQPPNFKNMSGKWGYIMNMYTLPAFRRQGISTGILNALMLAAGEHGITVFELHATPAGAEVYKHNGFELHNEPTYRKYNTPPEI